MRNAVLALLVLLITACRDDASPARDVERRILAPCCMRQTLEDHDSPIAHQLRLEVEQRASAGEPASAIEDDLVRRYGDKVRAMPAGRDPRGMFATVLGVAIALGALIAIGVFRAWRRRDKAAPTTRDPVARDDAAARARYEQQLDDELLDA